MKKVLLSFVIVLVFALPMTSYSSEYDELPPGRIREVYKEMDEWEAKQKQKKDWEAKQEQERQEALQKQKLEEQERIINEMREIVSRPLPAQPQPHEQPKAQESQLEVGGWIGDLIKAFGIGLILSWMNCRREKKKGKRPHFWAETFSLISMYLIIVGWVFNVPEAVSPVHRSMRLWTGIFFLGIFCVMKIAARKKPNKVEEIPVGESTQSRDGRTSFSQKLDELKNLRDSRNITEEEYQKVRVALLDRYGKEG